MNKKNKFISPKVAIQPTPQIKILTEVQEKLYGFDKVDENPHINLKYIQTSYQCFSHWSSPDLKSFSAFINKMKNHTWPQISTSDGFQMKHHTNRNALPKSADLEKISPDIAFFELRVTKRIRVHGFRVASAFFLVWLDKDHQVYKE